MKLNHNAKYMNEVFGLEEEEANRILDEIKIVAETTGSISRVLGYIYNKYRDDERKFLFAVYMTGFFLGYEWKDYIKSERTAQNSKEVMYVG